MEEVEEIQHKANLRVNSFILAKILAHVLDSKYWEKIREEGRFVGVEAWTCEHHASWSKRTRTQVEEKLLDFDDDPQRPRIALQKQHHGKSNESWESTLDFST